MSLDSVFMSPSSGRKTSNFFPSGDANGRHQGSTMTVESRGDGRISRGLEGELKGKHDCKFSGFGIENTDTELQGPAGGLGIGFLGDLGRELGNSFGDGLGSIDGDLGTGTGVGGQTSYINIGGLSLGLAMGVNGSYSIWSDKPKDGPAFSPFVDHGWSPRVEMAGLGQKMKGEDSLELQNKHLEVENISPRENIYLTRVNNPPFISQTSRPSKKVKTVSNNQAVVRLPAGTRETRRCPKFRDYFLQQNNDVNSEDYCSTFYKRNSLGYMFIKEPSNSLKVNSSGPRSWVQLKIKFPDTASAKKLKVDIKKLPFWKPINVNLKDPSRSKKSLKDKRRFNVLKRFQKHKGDNSF
ncbi:unnamed protein product [Debaryomyces fabryi]|nr:unnamed protein product [Debaryomyces fabryi]